MEPLPWQLRGARLGAVKMAVTGWLESLRAAEKTALLQDGNANSRVPSPWVRASAPEPGEEPQGPVGRQPGQLLHLQMRKQAQRDDRTGTHFFGHLSFP